MQIDGIKLVEGSKIQNLVVDAGTSFPLNPDTGELFYRYDAGNKGLYLYTGSSWDHIINSQDSVAATLPDSVLLGTYTSVTVNSKGLITVLDGGTF